MRVSADKIIASRANAALVQQPDEGAAFPKEAKAEGMDIEAPGPAASKVL